MIYQGEIPGHPNAQAGAALIAVLLVALAFVLFPTGQVLLALAVMAVLAGGAGVSLLIHRHGLAGCLYLCAARTRALADAVAVGQERHRRSRLEYVAEAKVATKCIQEAL